MAQITPAFLTEEYISIVDDRVQAFYVALKFPGLPRSYLDLLALSSVLRQYGSIYCYTGNEV